MFERRRQRQEQAQGARGVRKTDLGGRLLSDEAADYLDELARDGLARRTIDEARFSILKLFRFLACDPPLRDLVEETPGDFLRWLRATPSQRNRQGTVPKKISRESIRAFLAAVGKGDSPIFAERKLGQSPPGEQTVGKDWRTTGPFFRRLGLSTELRRRDRISTSLLPVRLPTLDAVAARWQSALDQAGGWAGRRDALRVIRTQALLLLTGMRLGECLAASKTDLEGRWLLLRKTKTRPRVIYASRLALGLARSLRQREQGWLFADLETAAFAGWEQSPSTYAALAREALRPIDCRLPAKPQQEMRQICSTYLGIERKEDAAESLQLGHGQKTLQQTHYLDAMARLPELMEDLAGLLPAIGDAWPVAEDVPLEMPDERRGGIWDELRRLLAASRRPLADH